MPVRFWTVASSVQASVPAGKLELLELEALFFRISIPPSLSLSLHLRVSVTQQHTLSSPPFLPFALCIISYTPPTPFLYLSPSDCQSVVLQPCQCQSSATGKALEPNDSLAETEQPLLLLESTALACLSKSYTWMGRSCCKAFPPTASWHIFTPLIGTKARDDQPYCAPPYSPPYCVWLRNGHMFSSAV